MSLKIKSLLLPGSKSITNRAFLLAALSEGKSFLKNPLKSDDTFYMAEALKKLGIEITEKENGFEIIGKKEIKMLPGNEIEIFIGNAGTTTRFLTPLLSSIEGGVFILKGEERMGKRPIEDLTEPLIKAGADITYLEEPGCPPLKIKGKKLHFKTIELDGSKSSQYISAILLLLPLINPNGRVLVKNLVSKPYIETTIEVMKRFGVTLSHRNYEEFLIEKGAYTSSYFEIPADASSASYFFASSFLKNRPIELNLGKNCLQGDFLFTEILKEMGASFEMTGEKTVFLSRKPHFKGISTDMNAIPDTVQTLAVLSLFAGSHTMIKNVANLRIKETDRLSALENELSKIGAKIICGKDFIQIIPSPDFLYYPTEVETYHDHRMAMSFALALPRIPGLKIKNPEVVSKSFPEFWKIWNDFQEDIVN
ncbi:MAG TPA: 3-phosphoshikimate 1-carboxyvinyltransferase [Spirochaetia bacterium]|nr:MAG: 3-phosphoshikimate 1-carboxyvinyltransferase [Spirochaetes bacterium GWB1_36_13]HCL55753.1 3-phosphoshikimate 1-carboxyvinyltransferase [Spirochaetia bacterium]